MRVRQHTCAWMPRGKVLVMTAILLPAIMGFMALSVDVSVIATSRAQLQRAADAASLGGAMKLADEARVRGATDITAEMTSAMTQAKTVAQANLVLNAAPVINDNTANSASGDVVVGYYNPATKSWVAPPLLSNTLANAVMVTTSRSTSHGGLVPGFFSRTWGYGGTAVTVSSIATAQNFPIKGYTPYGSNASNSPNAKLLPIVLDINRYNLMMARQTADDYAYDPTTGTVSPGQDGIYESQLYPIGSGDPGNWGTIQVGVTVNSTSVLNSQILYGITPSQLATYPNSTIALSGSPPSIRFTGNPGISAALKDALTATIGVPTVIPIYDQTGSNGTNAWYHCVAFQPVRILDVNFNGSNKYLVVQPCLVQDPTAITETNTSNWPPTWGWQSGGVVRVHLVQ